MPVRDAAPGELAPREATSGPGQQHDELWGARPKRLERGHEHVRALDQLGLQALAPPDSVFLERADDELLRAEIERAPRRRAAIGVDLREVLEIDADRNAEDARGIDAGREHEVVHLGMRHLN